MSCDCKNTDYGMTTKIWGPPTWFSLHMITFGFPADPLKYDRENNLVPGTTQQRYKEFFERVGFVLPCISCRDSYYKHLEQLPIDVSNRQGLIKWLFQIHNIVNKSLGNKPHKNLDCVKTFYEQYRAKSADDDGSRFIDLPKIPMKSCIAVYPDIERMKKMLLYVIIIIALAIVILVAVRFYFAVKNHDIELPKNVYSAMRTF